MGNEILLGIEAMTNHRMCISAGTGKVVIEDAATSTDYIKLSEHLRQLTRT